MLGERLMKGEKEFAQAWNFGPDQQSNKTVSEVLAVLRNYWPEIEWKTTTITHPHEAALLQLDATRAREKLGWKPVLSFDESLKMTADWYRQYLENRNILSHKQLQEYSERLMHH